MGTSTTLDAAASAAHAPKAKKPLWQGLGFQIVVAMILGAAVGLLFPLFASQLKILGDIFLRLIKTAVAPLVFLCVTIGIVSAGDFKRVGKVGLVAMIYFEIVSALALAFGLVAGNLLGLGTGMAAATATAGVKSPPPTGAPHSISFSTFSRRISSALLPGANCFRFWSSPSSSAPHCFI
jgi:aerobic C4-dicarboxylate transport protein